MAERISREQSQNEKERQIKTQIRTLEHTYSSDLLDRVRPNPVVITK